MAAGTCAAWVGVGLGYFGHVLVSQVTPSPAGRMRPPTINPSQHVFNRSDHNCGNRRSFL